MPLHLAPNTHARKGVGRKADTPRAASQTVNQFEVGVNSRVSAEY